MGTDTGVPGRFQGYFDHLELEEMVKAGLTPMQVIVAATKGVTNGTAATREQAMARFRAAWEKASEMR